MKALAATLFAIGALAVIALILRKFLSGFGSIEMIDGIALLVMSIAASIIFEKK